MQRLTSRFKRSMRRHQTGQAVVLLAIGFVVLLGFVGIVTDLSLMFVRYNALSRAIDSAAVAAAGQFSRKESDDVNFTRTTFAARQFLEFHGIDPSTVVVDTCTSIPAEWSDQEFFSGPDGEMGTADDVSNPNFTEYQTLDAISPDARTEAQQNRLEEIEYQREVHDAVCDDGSGRKLVRVQASVEVPTTFMNLFGQETFMLTAAAVSETASLDVVIVLDVSESMLYDTSMDDYDYFFFEDNSLDQRWVRYLPPNLSRIHNAYVANGGALSADEFRLEFLKVVTPGNMRAGGTDDDSDGYDEGRLVEVDGFQFELAYDRYVMGTDGTSVIPIDIMNPVLTGIVGSEGSSPYADIHEIRQDCRVQISPVRELIPNQFDDLAEVDANDYGADVTQREQYEALTGVFDRTNMFEANFRFYGCCNDPTAVGLDVDGSDPLNVTINHDTTDIADPNNLITNDFDFSDLVCQPFKQARDASTRFLYNIDFLAGDRVAIVTFDRSAMIMDPDGAGPEPAMIDDRNEAVNLLNRAVGVRAEMNFYHSDNDGNGVSAFEEDEGVAFRWTGYSAGIGADNYSTALEDADYLDLPVGAAMRAGLVFDSCGFDNAALPGNYSLWAYDDPSAPPPGSNSALAGEDGSNEDRMQPPWRSDAAWEPPLEAATDTDIQSVWGLNSYERYSQCRGTNFGAALRQANNALLDPDTVRTEGAVWVIVLLSDGAAGATDPIPSRQPDGSLSSEGAQAYLRDDGSTNYNSGEPAAEPALYGAYGFCPYGTSGDPVGYASTEDSAVACADGDPSERHYCYTEQDGEEGKTAIEINAVASSQIINEADDFNDGGTFDDDVCETEYDADDYARDWADFVALNRGTGGLTLLPTIFTIGFNLDYPDDTSSNCEGGNLQSCLGEELLRYIADVGDNNELNEDYPSTFEEDRFAQLSYGNYWNAPDEDELADVFDEIAGRLFTRLTG